MNNIHDKVCEVREKKKITFYKDIGFFNNKNLQNNIYKLKDDINKKELFLQNIENFNSNSLRPVKKLRKNNSDLTDLISNNASMKEFNSNKHSIDLDSSSMKINLKLVNKSRTRSIDKITNSTSHISINKSRLNSISMPKIIIKNAEQEIINNLTPKFTKNIDSSRNKFMRNSLPRKPTTIVDDYSLFNLQRNSSNSSSNVKKVKKSIPTKVKEDKNTRFVYNKIFDKKYQYLLNPDLYRKPPPEENVNQVIILEQMKKFKVKQKSDYVDSKINNIKTKLYFMKGIFDYSYPKVMGHKMNVFNDILFKEKNNREVKIQNQLNLLKNLLKNDEKKLNESILIENVNEDNKSQRMSSRLSVRDSMMHQRTSSLSSISKTSIIRDRSRTMLKVFEPSMIRSISPDF